MIFSGGVDWDVGVRGGERSILPALPQSVAEKTSIDVVPSFTQSGVWRSGV